jgi:hypothetical protein
MSAGEAVRAAISNALRARPEFVGVDGLVRDTSPNNLPQAKVEVAGVTDWSAKACKGREIRTLTTIRVSRGQEMRLPMMIVAAEDAGTTLQGALGDWQVGSAVLSASRSGPLADGTRRAVVEHRVRVMAH